MRKLFYILALALALSTSITACTEENVQPTSADGAGGGAPDPKN